MPIATATFRTPNASPCLKQLCKHFAHKVSAEWTEAEGRAELPGGMLTLAAASDELRIEIAGAEPKGLVQARYVLEDHLVRFAFREGLVGLCWEFQPLPAPVGGRKIAVDGNLRITGSPRPHATDPLLGKKPAWTWCPQGSELIDLGPLAYFNLAMGVGDCFTGKNLFSPSSVCPRQLITSPQATAIRRPRASSAAR